MAGEQQLNADGTAMLNPDGTSAVDDDCCCWVACGSWPPSASIWVTENLPFPPATDLFPANFTQGLKFHIDHNLSYTCFGRYALCDPPFDHDVGENTPVLEDEYYEESGPVVVAKLTSDYTLTPNTDVHFGVMVFEDWDDAGNIWINGTKRLAGYRANRYNDTDHRNCLAGGTNWYVETFAANDDIQVQIAVFDDHTSEVEWAIRMAFWYDGDPVPGGWPNDFRFRFVDNQA